MKTKPDKGAVMPRRAARIAVCARIGIRARFVVMVFVGNVGKEILGVADCPGRVVEAGRCYR